MQTSVEIIYNIVQGILYTILLYSMIGYDWKAEKFFYFMFFIIASFNYFTLFGMMLVALTPSEMISGVIMSFVLPLWNLFSGFLIVRTVRKLRSTMLQVDYPSVSLNDLLCWMMFRLSLLYLQAIPIWWRRYYWANPVSWTIYGVIASQFGNNNATLSVPGGSPVVLKQLLDDTLGIRHDFLEYIVLGHFAYIIAFFLVFCYSIKFLNFQKR